MSKLFKRVSSLPVTLYAFILILLPIVYILFLSFLKSDSYGGYEFTFTLQNYIKLFDSVYVKVFLQSFVPIATLNFEN